MTITGSSSRLYQSVAAVCPILGISIGTLGVSASVLIQFDPTATGPQKTAAQNIVNTFDWSAAAQTTWENTQARTAAIVALSDPAFAYKVDRAIALLTMNQLNLLRQWVTAFQAATAAATTFANFQTRVAALPNLPMPDLTKAQVLAAIQTQISGGNAD